MALYRCGVGETAQPMMVFDKLDAATYTGSLFTTGVNSINASGLSSGATHVLTVAKGKYDTLTLTGVTSIAAAKGVKADGTNESITPSNNVYDLSNYIGCTVALYPQTSFSATLS